MSNCVRSIGGGRGSITVTYTLKVFFSYFVYSVCLMMKEAFDMKVLLHLKCQMGIEVVQLNFIISLHCTYNEN